MGFLSGLFGRKAPAGPLRWEEVEGMDYPALLDIMKARLSGKDCATFTEMGHMQRRLFEIALWDNHVDEGHRASALNLAGKLGEDMTAHAAGNLDLEQAYKAAVAYMVDGAPYGTLAWLIEEHRVQKGQYAAFIVRPEHSHLVKAYFQGVAEVAKPEAMKAFRRDLIRELIADRRPPGAKNAVLILHGMATGREATLEALLDDAEITAFRNAHGAYDSARRAAVALGLLPEAIDGLPFDHAPDAHAVADLVMLETQALQKGDDHSDDLKDYLNGLKDDDRSNFQFALTVLTQYLALAHASAIWGEAFCGELRTQLLTLFPDARDHGIEAFWKSMAEVERDAYSQAGVGPDFMFLKLFGQTLQGSSVEATSEAGLDSIVQGGLLLSSHRILSIQKFRFMLRYFAAMKRGEPADRNPDDYRDDWIPGMV